MRMMKLMSAVAAAIVAGAALAPAAGAQEPRPLTQPDSIPLDLALALSATGGFGVVPQILVGAMPEWVMSKLSLPSGARVVGSAFIGTTVVGVVSVADAPAAAITTARGTLLAHGWKNPPPTPMQPGGGFRTAPPSMIQPNSTRMTLCSDPQLLTATAAPVPGGATLITYRMTTTTGYSPCRLPEPVVFVGRATSFPTLINPPNQLEGPVVTACFSAGGGSGPTAMLNTSLSPDSLLEYYGKQLADSGWKAEGATGGFVGRTWSRMDSTGRTEETSVVIRSPQRDPTCREAIMQVRTLNKP